MILKNLSPFQWSNLIRIDSQTDSGGAFDTKNDRPMTFLLSFVERGVETNLKETEKIALLQVIGARHRHGMAVYLGDGDRSLQLKRFGQ